MSFVTKALENKNTCPQSGLHGDLLFTFQTSLTSPGRARLFLLSACQGFHSDSHTSHVVSPSALVSFSVCPWSSVQHGSTMLEPYMDCLQGFPDPFSKMRQKTWDLASGLSDPLTPLHLLTWVLK